MRHSITVFLLLLTLVAASCTTALGAGTKLNTPLPTGSIITDFMISPDNRWVVFRVRMQSTRIYELYSVPLAGGLAVRLHDYVGDSGSIEPDYAVSPDSSRVVYRLSCTYEPCSDIYTADIAGGDVVKLNGLSPEGNVVYAGYFRISPDSTVVVVPERQEYYIPGFWLYAYPLRGGAGVLLDNGDTIGDIVLTPDSRTVVYSSRDETAGSISLHSAPIDGSESPRALVTVPLTARGSLSPISVSPDGRNVVFKETSETEDGYLLYDLYSVPVTGGSITLLSDPLEHHSIWEYRFSPDSSRVVYRINDGPDGQRFQLFSASVDGGDVVGLTAQDFGGLDNNGWDISPDSSRVVFIDTPKDLLSCHYQLYSIGITGEGWMLLSGQVADNVVDFRISPSGDRIAFHTRRVEDGACALYSVAAAGGTPVRLDDPQRETDFSPYLFTLRGTEIVYWARDDSPDGSGLYIVPAGGGASRRMSDVATSPFAISPDGHKLVHLRYNAARTGYDLYRAAIPPRDLWPLLMLLLD